MIRIEIIGKVLLNNNLDTVLWDLKNNPIEDLILIGCDLRDREVDRLIEVFPKCLSLRNIDLSENHISTAAIERFKQARTEFPNIKELSFSNNRPTAYDKLIQEKKPPAEEKVTAQTSPTNAWFFKLNKVKPLVFDFQKEVVEPPSPDRGEYRTPPVSPSPIAEEDDWLKVDLSPRP